MRFHHSLDALHSHIQYHQKQAEAHEAEHFKHSMSGAVGAPEMAKQHAKFAGEHRASMTHYAKQIPQAAKNAAKAIPKHLPIEV